MNSPAYFLRFAVLIASIGALVACAPTASENSTVAVNSTADVNPTVAATVPAVQTAATSVTPLAPLATPTSLSGDASLPTLETGALFRVVKSDGSAVAFTVDDIKALPLAQYMTEGKVEEGPRLLDVLAQAGVGEFNEVIISGPKSSQTLSQAQVDDQAILDLTNHGTVKLATPAVAKADWVKDVDLIVVH